jgi:hypothetical protein
MVTKNRHVDDAVGTPSTLSKMERRHDATGARLDVQDRTTTATERIELVLKENRVILSSATHLAPRRKRADELLGLTLSLRDIPQHQRNETGQTQDHDRQAGYSMTLHATPQLV